MPLSGSLLPASVFACTAALYEWARFIKPLAVDRLVAMVAPAMREISAGGLCPVFDELRRDAATLAHEPLGAGLDVPPWLLALDDEVQRVRLPEFDKELHTDELGLALHPMSFEEILEQLENWSSDRE